MVPGQVKGEGIGGRDVSKAEPPLPANSVINAPKLEISSVSYDYGGESVVDDVDLKVYEGEFVSILGPSGCGKTTLLRMVAGLLQPRQGRILIDGEDITDHPPEKRPLGMVFQTLALFPHLSVHDNIAFGLRLGDVPKPRIDERVRQMLHVVGLPDLGHRSVHELSGGQRQRVALARALAREPKILLLDEPLGALDLVIRREMQRELLSIQRRLEVTFLYVTHDQTEALTMSDRVVLMRQGRIVQDASPVDTYREPVNAFAANFVGDANILKGKMRTGPDGLGELILGTGVMRLPGREPRTEGDALVSIRPEQVYINRELRGGVTLDGTVRTQVFHGPDLLYEVETSVGTVLVREPAGEPVPNRMGEDVVLTLNPQALRVFSGDSGG